MDIETERDHAQLNCLSISHWGWEWEGECIVVMKGEVCRCQVINSSASKEVERRRWKRSDDAPMCPLLVL